MRNITILFAALVLLAAASLAGAAEIEQPKREIRGLHLGMTKEETEKQLKEIGTFERHERKQQEIWRVRDPSYSHIIIGREKDGRLRYITAVARTDEDAERIRYGSIANLERAKQTGDVAIKNFRFEWELPAVDNAPAVRVLAMGRDDDHLSTLTLRRMDDVADAD